MTVLTMGYAKKVNAYAYLDLKDKPAKLKHVSTAALTMEAVTLKVNAPATRVLKVRIVVLNIVQITVQTTVPVRIINVFVMIHSLVQIVLLKNVQMTAIIMGFVEMGNVIANQVSLV
jgi:hypothetical protein